MATLPACVAFCKYPPTAEGFDMAIIRDVTGAVLAEDASLDQRGLVADLVKRRKTLRRADLSGADLSRLDLRGASLPEARLDGADLSHALLDEASMRGASLVGANLKGARLDDAVCEAIVADGANLSGASLRRAWLIASSAVGARFDDADLAGADMSGAHVKASHFQRALMQDVRFADAELYGNDFREADLTSSEGDLPLTHRPDRALGARAVGNRFSPKAAICPSMKALRRDTWLGWASNASAAGAAGGLGSLAALAVIPNFVEGKVGLDLLGSGMSVIAMTTLPLFLRTVVGGRIRDAVQPHMDKLVLGVAEVLDRTAKAGVAAADVAALLWSGGTNALQKAVEATREKAGMRGWSAAFSRLSLGNIKVVFCDRRHLALALQEMSRPRLAGSRGDAETVLVRQGPPGEAPSALRLHSDGATTTVYPDGSVTWPERGGPQTVGSVPPDALAGGVTRARSAFEAALFADHGLTPIAKHWFTNHFEAGKDGSVLVVDHVARQVSNLVGPAVLSKDDTTTAIVDGRIWHGPRNRYDGPLQPGVDLSAEPEPAEEAATEPDYAPAPR
jgi:hypothetical protein